MQCWARAYISISTRRCSIWRKRCERKVFEILQCAIALIAQEKPEGLKKGFREDLYKNVASADGIFGLLPYAILTKVIRLVGWKRMELNKLIRFEGVSEGAFHSIFRRSLLIRIMARFIDD